MHLTHEACLATLGLSLACLSACIIQVFANNDAPGQNRYISGAPRPYTRPVHLPPPLNYAPNPNVNFLRYEGPDNSAASYANEDKNLNYVNYNTIEGKRFVEHDTSRCTASTIVPDSKVFEPSFVFIKPQSEVRLNATAPIDVLRVATHFDPSQPTVILVHGYTQSYPDTEWLRRVRALFEMHSQLINYNLIIMDWSTAAQSPYQRAAALTSLMGAFLANLIDKLIILGSNRSTIHIIGHSLGAHVSGFAGRRIKPRIGRITALDPAGPCFGKLYSNSAHDRLNADDAVQVDIFHYDDEFLGLGGQHGQFDVYVNGGSSQPGAVDNFNSMVGALITVVFGRKKVLSESHTRSYQVSMADLASSSNCQLIAYECVDYPSFMNGECGFCDQYNNQCFTMSFPFQYNHGLSDELGHMPLRTSFPGKRLYLTTSGNDPYCLFHDQVLVKLEPHPKLFEFAKKKKLALHLELFFDPRVDYHDIYASTNVTLTNLMSTSAFSYLMLGNIERRNPFLRARLHVVDQYDKSIVPLFVSSANSMSSQQYSNKDKLDAIKVSSIEINHMSKFDPKVRRALSSKLCPSDELSSRDPQNRMYAYSSYEPLLEYQSFVECPPY